MHRRLVRLFHTARHLKMQQIRGRLRRRLTAIGGAVPYERRERAPEYPGCRWSDRKDSLPPANDGICADALVRGEFRFLNTACPIGFPPDWAPEGLPKLWLYNLHYFDWLWVLDFDRGRRVALNWIEKYGRRNGRVGWEPYPTSVRLLNWCGYFFNHRQRQTIDDPGFCAALWRSIYHQGEWLHGHLETHLLANHYLENAAALIYAGSCFQGSNARKWSARGLHILREQIPQQILRDGVHFELSPMYHCRVLYVLILLMAMGIREVMEVVMEATHRMRQALPLLCHPDGGIALLGDSAEGICHEPRQLLSFGCEDLPPLPSLDSDLGSFALPEAGYYGWRGSDGAYVIADYGRIGPDYNPGHGHADMFSFEMSLNGRRVICDSGVHDYDCSPERRYCRSTAAHNTVEIDGQDQCELWGAFRVARRGCPRDVSWQPDRRGFTLSGWHDGYRRLPSRAIHARNMKWDAANGLTIRDTITARQPVRCVSRLHLHPACRILDRDRHCVHISYPGGSFEVSANVGIEVEETPYFESFYERQMRPCLYLGGRGSSVELQYRIRRRGPI